MGETKNTRLLCKNCIAKNKNWDMYSRVSTRKGFFLRKTFLRQKTHWEAEQIKGCKCVENKMLFNDVLKSYFKLKKLFVNKKNAFQRVIFTKPCVWMR